jgi:hypothetical protein
MMLESKTHNIKKEERERERERKKPWLGLLLRRNKTCKLCFVEFVNPRVNLNHISYFFKDGVTWQI